MLRVANAHARAALSTSAIAYLLVSAAATAAIITTGKHIPPWSFGLMLVVAAGCFFLLLRTETKRPSLRCWMVFAATAVLMALAVAVPPRTSNDVWAYSIYGRIVTAHNASPYVHAPDDYPSDPYFAPAKRGYHNIRSVYGPVWTGLSAGVMEIADENKTAARLLFQSIAALSVLGGLALLWRRTKNAGVLAFAGLNPVVAASIVNGGHNDALLGLTVLGGAFAAPAHPIIAGVILGMGASIKIVGLLPLAAVAVWTWYRRGFRRATTLLSSGLAIVVVGYLLAGGFNTLRPLGRGSQLIVRHSFWYLPRHWMITASELAPKVALRGAAHQIAIIGTGTVLFVTLIVVLSRFRRQRPEQLAAASMVPYLFGAPYVLPWYPGWMLPSLAPTRRTIMARLVAVQSIFIFVVDPDRFYYARGASASVIHAIQRDVIPPFEIVVVIGLVIAGLWHLTRRRPKPESALIQAPSVDDPTPHGSDRIRI
jgi:hypothetical protein